MDRQSFTAEITDLELFKKLDGVEVYAEIKIDNAWLITGRADKNINLSDIEKYDFVISIQKSQKIYLI